MARSRACRSGGIRRQQILQPRPDIVWRRTVFAQACKGGVARALRQFPARLVTHECVVMIERLRQSEQNLQQAVDIGGGFQVLTANNVGHALGCIVNDAGKMVAGAGVLARDHDITPPLRRERDSLCLGQRCSTGSRRCETCQAEGGAAKLIHCDRKRALHVESQRVAFTLGNPACDLAWRQAPAQPGIERGTIGIHGQACTAGRLGNLGARSETGVEEAHFAETIPLGGIDGKSVRLAPDRFLPDQSEPGEILQYPAHESLTRTAGVGILDPDNETSVHACGQFAPDQRRKCMADMELAGGARRETENGLLYRLGRHEICWSRVRVVATFGTVGVYVYVGQAGAMGAGRRVMKQKTKTTRLRQLPVAVISSDDDLRKGIRALRRKCHIMRKVHDATGLPPLRRRAAGFEGLARIIVGQQVSVASAAAIWSRCESVIRPMAPATVTGLTDEELRGAGLSRPKIRTLRAVADAVINGSLELSAVDVARDAEFHAALTAVSGIGPWTADIFLLACLGRPDAFPTGDLALQVAAQHAFELDRHPTAAELLDLAEDWRPWRSVSARLLWAYYQVVKDTKSGMPV